MGQNIPPKKPKAAKSITGPFQGNHPLSLVPLGSDMVCQQSRMPICGSALFVAVSALLGPFFPWCRSQDLAGSQAGWSERLVLLGGPAVPLLPAYPNPTTTADSTLTRRGWHHPVHGEHVFPCSAPDRILCHGVIGCVPLPDRWPQHSPCPYA